MDHVYCIEWLELCLLQLQVIASLFVVMAMNMVLVWAETNR